MLPGLLVLGFALCFAQTPAKEPTASIAGHVTMGGKEAAGVTVVAIQRNSFFDNKTIAKATTDDDGATRRNSSPVTSPPRTVRKSSTRSVDVNLAGLSRPGTIVNPTTPVA
jgi:hypothetical protein